MLVKYSSRYWFSVSVMISVMIPVMISTKMKKAIACASPIDEKKTCLLVCRIRTPTNQMKRCLLVCPSPTFQMMQSVAFPSLLDPRKENRG
jgi:hypothetical protein